MKQSFDLAVIGSGFGGTLAAMIGAKIGLSVVLIEKGKHPRFAIGESSTPIANLLLEELATRYDLPRLLPLTSWGSWQRSYPQVACGLKRGFTFFHHQSGRPCIRDVRHTNELLVAASPCDELSDTHWYRSDFDAFLVAEAREVGVTYWDQTHVQHCRTGAGGTEMEGTRKSRPVSAIARFVVDATGPRGVLHHHLRLDEGAFPGFPGAASLYSHFENVAPVPGAPHSPFCPAGEPYPADAAALHHVFKEGWMWVLRFNNGIISAGIAVDRAQERTFGLQTGAPGWSRFLERYPSIQEQFLTSRPTRDFSYVPRLAFRSERAVGPQWALLPATAGFVDPLLSTGFVLNLLGIQRMALIFEELRSKRPLQPSLTRYETQTFQELDTAALLIGSLYRTTADFEIFSQLTLLYFAAASYAETMRRLGNPQRANSFLLCDNARFVSGFRQCCQLARAEKSLETSKRLHRLIQKTIAPYDVAGLTDRGKNNWFPVDFEDLRRATPRLGLNPDRVERLIVEAEAACNKGVGPSMSGKHPAALASRVQR